MLDQIPTTESLHDTKMRSRVYWDEVIAPALRAGKTLLIVGHENNLRSMIMRLEDISKDDIINLDLPRGVPLAYRLNPDTLKPQDRPDGKLDEATGFLRGHWLGGDKAVSEILQRDHHQVYNTNVTQNLEVGPSRENWKRWMEFAVGPASPEARAKAEENHTAISMKQQHNSHDHLDVEPNYKSAASN
jgi:2,3-bisphosphoglycerate-dependent phosphoglycerate mutase